MSRKSIALILSTALVLSSLSSGVSAQSAPAKPDQTTSVASPSDPAKNASPLPAGNAAGLQQAQGLDSNEWILVAVGGALLIGLLVWGLSNNNSSSSTAK